MIDTGLTSSEEEVLYCTMRGLSVRDTAQSLHLGESTVKTHRTRIVEKMESPNIIRAAIVYLHRIGLLAVLP